MGQRFVDIGLERHMLAAAQPFVGGQDDAAVAVGDASGERIGRKAGKDDRMDRADPRAGEHCHRSLGHHRQIDGHAFAALHPLRFEQISEAADVGVQLAIADRAVRIGGIVGFPQDRDRVAALGEMAIDRIGRKIERPVGEPGDAEIAFVEARLLDAGKGPHPVDALRLIAPEGIGLLDRLPVHRLIGGFIDQRIGRPGGRHRINRLSHRLLLLVRVDFCRSA